MAQKYEESFNNKCLIFPTANESWNGRAESLTARKVTNEIRMRHKSEWRYAKWYSVGPTLYWFWGREEKQAGVSTGRHPDTCQYVPVPRSNTPHVWSYQIRTWQYVHVPRNNTHGSHLHASHYHSMSSTGLFKMIVGVGG